MELNHIFESGPIWTPVNSLGVIQITVKKTFYNVKLDYLVINHVNETTFQNAILEDYMSVFTNTLYKYNFRKIQYKLIKIFEIPTSTISQRIKLKYNYDRDRITSRLKDRPPTRVAPSELTGVQIGSDPKNRFDPTSRSLGHYKSNYLAWLKQLFQ